MKTCLKCRAEKHDSDFSPTARWCRPCRNEYSREHYLKNKDRIRQYQNGWRDENLIQHRGYNQKYREANREKANAGSKRWAEENPIRRFAGQSISFKRRNHADVSLTIDDIVEIWHAQNGLCALSGIPMKSNRGARGGVFNSPSIDRIVPSAGYHRANVRLLCFAVNAGRGTLRDDEYVEVCRAVVAIAESKV